MSQPNYRYPGLKPFEVREAALFFGRAQETRDLYNLVKVEHLVVLFAKSGMGKTSLLNAGLIPMLAKSDLLPIYVRFNNTAQTLHEQFLQKMESEGVAFDPKYSGKTLWEQLKYAKASKNGRPATPLIIFDQFEEIFTLYTPEQRLHFIRDFADVANQKIPQTVQAELLRLVQENPEVPDGTLAELERQPSVQCIFSIRSDLLHLLNALSPQIPDILRSRCELGPLSEKGAREAMVLPAGLPTKTAGGAGFASPPFQYDEAALAEIHAELSQHGKQSVESFQLQIICQAIEKLVIQNTTKQSIVTVSPGLYGGAAGIQRLLTDFYTDTIGELPEAQRLPARRIVEQELITDTERRRSVDEGDLLKRNATSQLLNQLVEMRLLRKEPRLDSYYYEISHDTLVPPILVKYRERRREEERLEELERKRQEQAERDALLAAERRKRVRALRITLYSLTLAAISVAAMLYAIWQRNIAERDKRRAYANDIAFKSQIALRDGDRTAAFRLAAFAHRYAEADNPQAARALAEALYYNDHQDSTHRLPWHYNLEGHNAALRGVAFSPDGKKLATCSEDNTANIWNIETGEPIATLSGHQNIITSIAFSPDGKKLVTGSEDNTVKIWDAGTGKADTTLKGHEASVVCVAFSPDGERLATGSQDNTAKIWELKTGAAQTLEGHDGFVGSISFSPNGQLLATASEDYSIRIWDIKTGKSREPLKAHSDIVSSVAFSPDGKKIATGSHDKTAKIWDVASGKVERSLEGHNGWVSSVAFSPDGKKLATGSYDNTAKIWNPEAEIVIMRIVGHSNWVRGLAFSPDGQTLATASNDRTAKIWDLAAEGAAVVQKHGDIVSSVAFSPNGKKLATGSYDKTVVVTDLDGLKKPVALTSHGDTVMCVAFSPDGKRLASGAEDNTAKIWDLETGKETTTLKGHSHYVNSVAFSPDGKLLATGSADSTAKVWTIATGEAKTLREHSGVVSSVAFSPDGKNLATGSADNTVKIWDLSTGKTVRTLKGHSEWVRSVAFSPDGKRLATGSDDATAKVWDLKTGKAIMTLEGHLEYGVSSVAFSPDGKKLATGSQDWTVKIWSLESGEPMLTLEGHGYAVSSVIFSPDGKRLATGSEDATAKVWELDATNIVGKLHSSHRLAPLIEPQLDTWDLDGLLDIKSENEQRLRETREPWQIAAFADRNAQRASNNSTTSDSKNRFSRAARLYEYALESGNDALKRHIARKYNDLAVSQLYIPDGKAAETSLKRGLDLDPANPDLPANLAHALLLQGRYAEAEKIYLAYKSKPYKGDETYSEMFLNTLKRLEGQGVAHPDIERARALIRGGGM